jgi:hypothetical protein
MRNLFAIIINSILRRQKAIRLNENLAHPNTSHVMRPKSGPQSRPASLWGEPGGPASPCLKSYRHLAMPIYLCVLNLKTYNLTYPSSEYVSLFIALGYCETVTLTSCSPDDIYKLERITKLKQDSVTETLMNLCTDKQLNFQAKGKIVQKGIADCTREQIIEHLNYAGVIPECYGHDSTEEKIFAKYCDALLARALCEIGLEARAIEERSDAADVIARGDAYTLVGDAKAFRLSRTAKNQKDFKIEALNAWRKEAEYACLVCPLYQYPNKNSQIYGQAIRYNVTLLSYTHLSFLIRHEPKATSLRKLWEANKSAKPSKSAGDFWPNINDIVLEITHKTGKDWENAVRQDLSRLPFQAKEQIKYLEGIKEQLKTMPKEVLVRELAKALKIEAKIRVIKETAGLR